MNLLSLRPVCGAPRFGRRSAYARFDDCNTRTEDSGHAIDVADDSHRFVSTQAVKCGRPLPKPSAGGKGLILPFLFGGHRQLALEGHVAIRCLVLVYPQLSRRTVMRHAFIGLIGAAAALCASTAMAQTARDIRGPAPVVPLASEPAPRIRTRRFPAAPSWTPPSSGHRRSR